MNTYSPHVDGLVLPLGGAVSGAEWLRQRVGNTKKHKKLEEVGGREVREASRGFGHATG